MLLTVLILETVQNLLVLEGAILLRVVRGALVLESVLQLRAQILHIREDLFDLRASARELLELVVHNAFVEVHLEVGG